MGCLLSGVSNCKGGHGLYLDSLKHLLRDMVCIWALRSEGLLHGNAGLGAGRENIPIYQCFSPLQRPWGHHAV